MQRNIPWAHQKRCRICQCRIPGYSNHRKPLSLLHLGFSYQRNVGQGTHHEFRFYQAVTGWWGWIILFHPSAIFCSCFMHLVWFGQSSWMTSIIDIGNIFLLLLIQAIEDMAEVADLLRLKYSHLPRPVGPVIYGELPSSKPQEEQVDWLIEQRT